MISLINIYIYYYFLSEKYVEFGFILPVAEKDPNLDVFSPRCPLGTVLLVLREKCRYSWIFWENTIYQKNKYTRIVMSEYTSIKAEVLQKIETNLPTIRERFGVETLGIFGSVSRGEDTPESDVDVLYRFEPSRGGMFDLVGLHDYLVDLFGREVDMISVDFISPLIVKQVKNDAILYSGATA